MARLLQRRTLLRMAWAGVIAPLFGSRELRAAIPGPLRRLRDPVSIPLWRVSDPWQIASFKAWTTRSADGSSGPPRDALLKGILVRLATSEETSEETPEEGQPALAAFCTTCPHEICDVDFIRETGHVRTKPSAKPDHPLLVCPCHFSVFDPASEGRPIAGPAHRGLYRFEHRVVADRVDVLAIEEAAL